MFYLILFTILSSYIVSKPLIRIAFFVNDY